MSTIINAIYTMTGNASYLFQVKSLTWEHGGQQALLFQQSLLEGKDALYRVDWDFIQGEHMEGVVIGGNTRCFLKLAGTPYMPDFSEDVYKRQDEREVPKTCTNLENRLGIHKFLIAIFATMYYT